MRRTPSISRMPARPGIPLMSITWGGLASRSFMSGMRLWPPESTLASSPSLASNAVASARDVGAWYSNAAGIIGGPLPARRRPGLRTCGRTVRGSAGHVKRALRRRSAADANQGDVTVHGVRHERRHLTSWSTSPTEALRQVTGRILQSGRASGGGAVLLSGPRAVVRRPRRPPGVVDGGVCVFAPAESIHRHRDLATIQRTGPITRTPRGRSRGRQEGSQA